MAEEEKDEASGNNASEEEEEEPIIEIISDKDDYYQEQDEESEEDTLSQKPDFDELNKSLAESQDRYVRLYADFENFKRITAKNKQDLLKYSNESIMSDLLTVIDHLELALQHSSGNTNVTPLIEGVEMTLKELKSILEKHGLSPIDTLDRPFDPNIHHAMSQINSEEVDENTVIKEFRKGYMYKERVLRAALVGVSKKTAKQNETTALENEEE